MIDKRFWSGAIVLVTLIVAGAGALPELLLRPASTGPTLVLPQALPKIQPTAEIEQMATVVNSASLPALEIISPLAGSTVAAPEPTAVAPDSPKLEPEVRATPAPAPPVAFPPVQPVGVAAASVADAVPPAAPQAMPAKPLPRTGDRPAQAEPAAQRPTKPKQHVRPAAYPIGEFLAWRR